MMFLTQVVMFLVLSRVHSFTALAASAFVVLFCYGGGFGTIAGVCRRLLRSAKRRLDLWADADGVGFCRGVWADPDRAGAPEHRPLYRGLEMIAGIMLISAVLPFVIRPPRDRNAESTDPVLKKTEPVLNQRDEGVREAESKPPT